MLVRLDFSWSSDLAESLFEPMADIPVLLIVILRIIEVKDTLGVRGVSVSAVILEHLGKELTLDFSSLDIFGAVQTCATLGDFGS